MLKTCLTLLCLFSLGSVAHGDPLVSGSFKQFSFGPVGSPADSNPYTFVGAGTVTVLDGFKSGDSFTVFDGSTLLGNTSTPVLGDKCGASTAKCLADSNFSRGVFTLGQGNHAINIVTLTSPFFSGAAFIGLDVSGGSTAGGGTTSPVPEPGSLILLGTGALSLFGAARRKLLR